MSLEALPTLEWVSLDGTILDDDGARALGDVGQIRGLSLAGTGIGDAAVDCLIAIESLDGLDISHTKITAVGFTRLAKHPKLSKLVAQGIPLDMTTLDASFSGPPKVEIWSEHFDALSKAARLMHSAQAWAARPAHRRSPRFCPCPRRPQPGHPNRPHVCLVLRAAGRVVGTARASGRGRAGFHRRH